MTKLVFWIDVDNTLLNNDAVKDDENEQLRQEIGPALAARYWEIYEEVRKEKGVIDIPLALTLLRQQTPLTKMNEQQYLHVHDIFENYPFEKALYPYAQETLYHLGTIGLTVLVSDGDLYYQVKKIVNSNLAAAVEERVLLFIHKQEHLDEIMQRYPADQYVLIDDKPQILHETKDIMGQRLTTVFVKQGKYASARLPDSFAPDITVPHIKDLRHSHREQFFP